VPAGIDDVGGDAHAGTMAPTRFWDRRGARRLAVVDAVDLPGSVRQRFALHHPDLTADGIRTAEAATRQWFRLAAAHPRALMSMPSVVVDEVWHEFVLHTREYADFCDAAFGRFLHHEPESAMSPGAAAANRSAALATTLRLARADERAGPGEDRLPLIFRVDDELRVVGGKRYLLDCGGRGQCYDVRGTTCLQHLGGSGKRVRGDWGRKMPGPAEDAGNGSQGCGAAW
jgi:hypothetical protein